MIIISEIKKSINWYITITIILTGLLVIGAIYSQNETRDFSILTPTSSIPLELFILFVIYTPIIASISVLWSGWVLGPILLWIHKKINQKKCVYGITEQFKVASVSPFQAVAPIFLAMNLAYILCTREDVILMVLGINTITGSLTDYYMSTFVILLTLFVSIGFIIFTPIWFLINAGIVYTNTIDPFNQEPTEIKTVGGWFVVFLKGYIGISTIFTYYAFVVQIMTQSGTFELVQLILVSLLTFGLPLVYTVESIPAILILHKFQDKSVSFMRNVARKWGIEKKVKINFI